MSAGGHVVCPACRGHIIPDRGPLDPPHCGDCGLEISTGPPGWYDHLFVHRAGILASLKRRYTPESLTEGEQ